MNYLDILAPNIDHFGCIAQSDGDGGDTINREGMLLLWSYEAWKQDKIDYKEYCKILSRYRSRFPLHIHKPKSGNLLRHPDPSKWYGQDDRMSRDQWLPNLLATELTDCASEHNELRHGWAKRLFLFTTNTIPNHVMPGDTEYHWKVPDLTLFQCWQVLIRASFHDFGVISSLLLNILDLEALANSIMWVLKPKLRQCLDSKKATKSVALLKRMMPKAYEKIEKLADKLYNDVDILNHFNLLLYCKRRRDTVVSRWARKIFKKHPIGVQKCFDIYFRPETFAPRFDIIARDIVDEVLST